MVHDADIATSGDAAISCSNMVESDFCNIQVKYFQTDTDNSTFTLSDRSRGCISEGNQDRMPED